MTATLLIFSTVLTLATAFPFYAYVNHPTVGPMSRPTYMCAYFPRVVRPPIQYVSFRDRYIPIPEIQAYIFKVCLPRGETIIGNHTTGTTALEKTTTTTPDITNRRSQENATATTASNTTTGTEDAVTKPPTAASIEDVSDEDSKVSENEALREVTEVEKIVQKIVQDAENMKEKTQQQAGVEAGTGQQQIATETTEVMTTTSQQPLVETEKVEEKTHEEKQEKRVEEEEDLLTRLEELENNSISTNEV